MDELDEKIKMLISKRISLEEVQSSLRPHRRKGKGGAGDARVPLLSADAKKLYGELFYLLLSKPRYLASLTRLVKPGETETFMQAVVLTLYGDQYETREERSLLLLFQQVLMEEFKGACNTYL